MTVKECYEMVGGDYEGVLSRLRKDERIEKFALKFLDDGSYQLLCDSLAAGNYDEAFRASHTIKGVCQNLGFDKLHVSADALTEKLRAKDTDGLEAYIDCLKEDYAVTIQAIQGLLK